MSSVEERKTWEYGTEKQNKTKHKEAPGVVKR